MKVLAESWPVTRTLASVQRFTGYSVSGAGQGALISDLAPDDTQRRLRRFGHITMRKKTRYAGEALEGELCA